MKWKNIDIVVTPNLRSIPYDAKGYISSKMTTPKNLDAGGFDFKNMAKGVSAKKLKTIKEHKVILKIQALLLKLHLFFNTLFMFITSYV